MPDFRVLQNEAGDSSISNNSVKVQYLSEQKNRMQVELEELRLNNKILRNINDDLAKGCSEIDLKELILRNQSLQYKLGEVSRERQKIMDEMFILNQIKMENDKQLHQISSNYEQKIIELRRSIQFKESILQKAEAQGNVHQDYQEIILPPYNVSMHFYQEFQEYKGLNKILTDANHKLKQHNQILLKQNQNIAKDLQKLKNLATSQCSFIQYKALLREGQIHSMPHKSKTSIKSLQKKPVSSVNKSQSNEITGHTFTEVINKKNLTLKRIIKKQQIQINQLKQKNMLLTAKNKELVKSMQTILQSNKFYQKIRTSQNEKLEGYRIEAVRYKEVLLRRRPYIRTMSVDEKVWCQMKPIVQEKLGMQKKRTVIGQLRAAGEQLRNMGDPVAKRKERSNSCIFDYTAIQIGDEQIEKPIKVEKSFLGDETIGFEKQFSIIAGGKKINYAQLKKGKNANNIVKIGGFLEEIF